LLVQNEVNSDAINLAIEIAYEESIVVCLNPSPFPKLSEFSFEKAHLLLMNSTETNCLANLANQSVFSKKLEYIMNLYPNLRICVSTLGSEGAICAVRNISTNHKIEFVNTVCSDMIVVIDTTGAGDCFTGYFISSLIFGINNNADIRSLDSLSIDSVRVALNDACIAAGRSCEKRGAISSMPLRGDI
jgi:ribokinase